MMRTGEVAGDSAAAAMPPDPTGSSYRLQTLTADSVWHVSDTEFG